MKHNVQRYNSVLHWQLHNPLLSNMSNLFNVQCELVREPGKQGCDTTTTRQRGRIPNSRTNGASDSPPSNQSLEISSWVVQPRIGPFGLQQHPVQALMELTDHISQQGQCSQQSRTRQSWWPRAQRPTIKPIACCAVGIWESRQSKEEPSLQTSFQCTTKLQKSVKVMIFKHKFPLQICSIKTA